MSKLSNKNSGAIVFTDLKRPSVKIGYARSYAYFRRCGS